MTLSRKFWALTLFLLFSNILCIGYFCQSMSKMSAYFEESSRWFHHAMVIQKLATSIDNYDHVLKEYAESPSPAKKSEAMQIMQDVSEQMDRSLKLARAFKSSEYSEEKELNEKISLYLRAGIRLLMVGEKYGKVRASDYQWQIYQVHRELVPMLQLRTAEEEGGASFWSHRAGVWTEKTYFFGLRLLFLLMFVSLSGMLYISVGMHRKFRLLNHGIGRIAAGDLDTRIKIPGKDEFTDLAAQFNGMALKLKENIHSLEKSQAHLLQAEKMSAIGQLASGVAHEINNPLSVILGFAQSLKARFHSDETVVYPLGFIENEAKRCKEIVQNLLLFSRSSQPRFMEEADINEIIRNSIPMVFAQSRVRSVNLVTNYHDDLPAIVVNGNQIQQILINLCNNAMDAMPNGGELCITSDLVEQGNESWVTVSVKDSGAGISPEVLSKIFDPFFTTKEVGKGTGLGLSITSEILKKHNGRIDVKSESGQGSEFIVYLPASQTVRLKSAA